MAMVRAKTINRLCWPVHFVKKLDDDSIMYRLNAGVWRV